MMYRCDACRGCAEATKEHIERYGLLCRWCAGLERRRPYVRPAVTSSAELGAGDGSAECSRILVRPPGTWE